MNRPRAARALSDLLKPALADALKAQGFAAADILGRWPDIAGPRLAAASLPVRILFPPRPKAAPPDKPAPPATLVLKVESAYALEVEMQSAEIIERINRVFGWRCIGRLRLRQGPVTRPEGRRASAPAPLELATVGFAEALGRQAHQVRLRATGGLPAHFSGDGRAPRADTPGAQRSDPG